jgi:hypothetical protein
MLAGHQTGWVSRLQATLVIAFGLWLTASGARANTVTIRSPFNGERPMLLDLHLGFTHLGVGPALGARFSIPIVHNGFVPVINNAVFITFGGDFFWVKVGREDYAAAVGIPVTLNWQFYFTRKWSAFGELGFNIYLAPAVFEGDGWYWAPGQWAIAAVGGRYQVNDSFALVLRVGNPYSCIGVTFSF